MATRRVISHGYDWLIPAPAEFKLFHSDPSDQIFIYPFHLGQGYLQKIQLRDDLTLEILDVTPHHDLVIDTPDDNYQLKFQFQLLGFRAGYSFIEPHFGGRIIEGQSARNRLLTLKIFVGLPTFATYFQQCIECLPSSLQLIVQEVLQHIYCARTGRSIDSKVTIDQVLNYQITPDSLIPEQVISVEAYTRLAGIDNAVFRPLTSAIKSTLDRILSCPYQGLNRRTYLQNQAFNLINLKLESLAEPQCQTHCLSADDLVSIEQAEKILRSRLSTPPSLDNLARQVGLNRLKLNQGFHQVYRTSPFSYLRDCRVTRARHLLMNSDLSVSQVATQVGYTSRSRFSQAFCQYFGLSPKKFHQQY